ncbi:MAG: hypothetical protein ACREAU_01820 [Nitrosopumilaceae archaeon]
MYVNPNFDSKKALVEALKKGVMVDVFPPGLGEVPLNDAVSLEGPHYPKPHKWYATGTMVNGKLVKVK